MPAQDATRHVIRSRVVEDFIVLTSGAGQIEMGIRYGTTLVEIVLNHEQAAALALDLLARTKTPPACS